MSIFFQLCQWVGSHPLHERVEIVGKAGRMRRREVENGNKNGGFSTRKVKRREPGDIVGNDSLN